MLYNICGFKVEFDPMYPQLKNRAEKYLVNGDEQADFSLNVTRSEIEDYTKKNPHCSEELAEYVLSSIEFYNKILDYDAFFLHSSAVARDNEAYLFTAPCGGGKSTHARLWRNVFPDCRAINDDKPVIRRINGKFFACGTPFSGKHDINANLIIPLQGICVIEKANENRIEKISALDAAPLLFEQTLRTVSAKRAQVLLSLFDDLLSNIPVYSLRCNITPEAAYTSYSAMSGKKP